ncbi:SPFH domain-containing protein [Vibrio sp. V17_P4S1T151]|nr:SPFH domain-containing protein [Vibrio sp. V17_P4S1T151]
MFGAIAVAVFVLLASMIVIVKPKQGVLINFFGGRIVREISEPGIYFKLPAPIHGVANNVSFDIFQITEDCTVKTADEVILGMSVNASVRVMKNKMQEACYDLDDPESLIKSDLRQMTCSECDSLETKEIYSSKGDMTKKLIDKLNKNYNQYGYEITDVKIDDPKLPTEVRDASNRVVSAKRTLEAAKIEKDAKYELKMADARADAGALEERTRAAVKSRESYAQVCVENLNKFKNSTTDASEINMLMMSMEAMDTRDSVTTAARYGNLVLLGTSQASNEMGLQAKVASQLKKSPGSSKSQEENEEAPELSEKE